MTQLTTAPGRPDMLRRSLPVDMLCQMLSAANGGQPVTAGNLHSVIAQQFGPEASVLIAGLAQQARWGALSPCSKSYRLEYLALPLPLSSSCKHAREKQCACDDHAWHRFCNCSCWAGAAGSGDRGPRAR